MRRFSQALEDFWFPHVPAKRLALLRIAAGLFSLWYVSTHFEMLDSIGETSRVLFDPVGLAQLLNNPIPSDAFRAIVTLTLSRTFFSSWGGGTDGLVLCSLYFFFSPCPIEILGP